MLVKDRSPWIRIKMGARETRKRWRDANREAINAYLREWKRRARAAKGPPKAKLSPEERLRRRRENVRNYARTHKEKKNSINRNRRARKKAAQGTHNAKDIAWLRQIQKGRCAHSWCRKKLGEDECVDHVIALARGGGNDRKNLQLLCQSCNLKKHAKHPIDFAQQNGLLL